MKTVVFVAAVLLCALVPLCHAQPTASTGVWSTAPIPGGIGGSCTPNINVVAGYVTSAGQLVTCQSNVWTVVSGSSSLSGQTTNCLPKAATATTSTSSAAVCDNGTNITSTEPVQAPSFSGTGSDPAINLPSNTTHSFSSGDLVNNAGTLQFNNGTSTVDILTSSLPSAASGTLTLPSGAINAGACSTATASSSMVNPYDRISLSGQGSLKAVTGYGGAGLQILPAYATTNTINVDVCNFSASSITPGSATIQWTDLGAGVNPSGFVQVTSITASSGTSLATTFGSSPVVGDAIVVACDFYANGNTVSASDNQGNSYTQVGTTERNASDSSQSLALFLATVTTSSGTFTVSCQSTASASGQAVAAEYRTHVMQSATAQNQGGASGTTATSGNMTTSASSSVVVLAVSSYSGTFSSGSGYTLRASSSTLGFEDANQSSSGTYNPSMTSGNHWAAVGVILQ